MRKLHRTGLGLLSLSVAAIPLAVSAQETRWVDQFGTEGFDALYAVDDITGDLYTVGEVEGALPGQVWGGSCDIVVRKYAGNQTVLWTRQFGAEGCDFAQGVAAVPEGVYVGGTVERVLPGGTPEGVFDGLVRKYDADGTELWTDRFGTGDFVSVNAAAVHRGSLYVTGQTCGALPGQQPIGVCDAFVRKYDSAGNELWTSQFGATVAAANDVFAGPMGVVVVGRVAGALPGQTAAGGRDVFVRLYDPRGKERWTRQFGTGGNDIAWGVDVDGSRIYVAGDAGGELPGQQYAGGPLDAFLRVYDGKGNELWTRQFGTTGFDRAIRVAGDGDQVVVVGRAGGPLEEGLDFAGGTDPFVRRYDADGTSLWTIQFGGDQEPEAATGVTLDDGDIFVVGGRSGAFEGFESAGYIDAFTLKLRDDQS